MEIRNIQDLKFSSILEVPRNQEIKPQLNLDHKMELYRNIESRILS
jgi:hypothetical protein